jgi:hypothetical protein
MATPTSSQTPEEQKKAEKEEKQSSVSIGGNVNGPIINDANFQGPVQFGNTINAQEYVQGNKTEVGSISNSTGVVTGDNAQVNIVQNQGASAEDIIKIFSMLQQQVDKMPEGEEKDEAKGTVEKLQAEAVKGEDASESKVEKYLKFLAASAPDILEVAINTFINPASGVSTVLQKVAQRIKAEREKAKA